MGGDEVFIVWFLLQAPSSMASSGGAKIEAYITAKIEGQRGHLRHFE
jgi:hypothetical protein